MSPFIFPADDFMISYLVFEILLDFEASSEEGGLSELHSPDCLFLLNENRFTTSGFGLGDNTGGRKFFSD